MTKTTPAEEAFQALLQGEPAKASPQLEALVRFAAAIEPASRPGPDPRFAARLRNELLAQASATEEDLFAAMLEGDVIAAPEELRPLVAVASALAPASLPSPDIAFRYRLRNSLVVQSTRRTTVAARIADKVADVNARLRSSLRVVAATGMAALMMLGGSAAMAAASSSLPGDTLYGLKQLKESAQLSIVSGDREGVLLLEFARIRLEEIQGLDARGELDEALYTSALEDMDSLTTTAADIIIGSFRARGGREPKAMRSLADFAQTQRLELTRLLDRLPPAVRPTALDSLVVAEAVESRTVTVLANPACPCPNSAIAPPTGASGEGFDPVACECAPTGSNGTTGSSQGDSGDGDTQDPGNGSGDDPGDGDGDGDGEDPGDDGDIDVPDVDGTTVDEDAEDLINDLIDDLDLSSPVPTPTPLPTLPLP